MARDGHDYDMGCHAPWCSKCDHESEAMAEAQEQYEEEQGLARTPFVKALAELVDRYQFAHNTGKENQLGLLLDEIENTVDALRFHSAPFDGKAWAREQRDEARDRAEDAAVSAAEDRAEYGP